MLDRFERFTSATVEVNKYCRKLSAEEMEKHGLKAPHSIYFTVLSKYNLTGLTAAQLCRYCGRDKADVSRMMSIMQRKGFVKKESSGKSKYNGVFKLTERGHEIAEHIKKRVAKAVEIAGKDLSEENRAAFYNALDSIVSNLREMSMKGIPE